MIAVQVVRQQLRTSDNRPRPRASPPLPQVRRGIVRAGVGATRFATCERCLSGEASERQESGSESIGRLRIREFSGQIAHRHSVTEEPERIPRAAAHVLASDGRSAVDQRARCARRFTQDSRHLDRARIVTAFVLSC